MGSHAPHGHTGLFCPACNPPRVMRKQAGGVFLDPRQTLAATAEQGLRALGARPADLGLALGEAVFRPDGRLAKHYPPGTPTHVVAGAARAVCERDGGAVVGRAVCKVGDKVLWEATESYAVVPGSEVAARLAEMVAEEEMRWALLLKATPTWDPSDPADMLVIEGIIKAKLATIMGPVDKSHLKAIFDELDPAWLKGLKPDQLSLVAKKVNGLIGPKPSDLPPAMKVTMAQASKGLPPELAKIGLTVAAAQKAKVSKEVRGAIGLSLDQPDKDAINALAGQTTFFIRDSYGTINTSMGLQAQAIVRLGMKKGLSGEEIANDLRKQLGPGYEAKRSGYYAVVANSFMGRARERASLNAYLELGIETVTAIAMMDEDTTQFCRWVDGQVLDVRVASEIAKQVDAIPASDPGAIVDVQPWVQHKGKEVGVKVGGKWTPILQVNQAAEGKDQKGSYKLLVAGGVKGLGKLGVGFPPYHGHCRTVTSTIMGAQAVQTVVPANLIPP